MKKIIICWLIGIIAFSSIVIANEKLNIVVDGKDFKLKIYPHFVGDSVVVGIRDLAESLGAKVDWYETTRTVNIDSQNKINEQRIKLLEQALQQNTPEGVAKIYSEGVKTRNGALQYAVLSPELKEKSLKDYQSWYWVTGASSPWMESYTISKPIKQDLNSWKFDIDYILTDSTDAKIPGKYTLIIQRYGESWCISNTK